MIKEIHMKGTKGKMKKRMTKKKPMKKGMKGY